MSKATVAELEVLFTADTKGVDKGVAQVKAAGSKVEGKPIKATVDAEVKGALAGMGRVEAEAKKLVSEKTMATVDANIERATKNLTKTQERLDYLKSVETDLEVTADIKRAEASLARAQRQVDGLTSARAKLEVIADTSKAESELEQLADTAESKGREGGQRAGAGLASTLDGATRGAGQAVGDAIGGDLGSSLESALTAIPVAGGIILAAAAIGKAIAGAIEDGMQIEAGRDRLQALTGIDEHAAARLASAAGEAYAQVFGESIEANMDTARLALQSGLIDEKSTTRASTKVIEGLAGIADVLGEDVRPVAAAVTQMLRTGMVKSADEAFDVLATGAREGVNLSEDLIDTFVEYPALFQRLGLTGEEALGLVSQGMKNGARNSDLAADALKEFQIRATDGSKASAEGYALLGLSAEKMTAQIAEGGTKARDGLAEVLTKLRETEDPVQRNAAAVALFGTQAEDLGQALFSMDLSSAVTELGAVTGAARTMFDTLSNNDATKMEEAQRNIELAMDGVKGALASAFSEPLGDLADWVSSNRGPLLFFFQDLVNGALDFAEAANTAIGDFVSGPLASMVEGLAGTMKWVNPFADTTELDNLAKSMKGFDETTADANDKIEVMRSKFNTFADAQVSLGFAHDAQKRTAIAIDEVGVAADGSALKLAGLDTANLSATATGKALGDQVQSVYDALQDEMVAAAAAGDSQADLEGRYKTTTDALRSQLSALGLTDAQVSELIGLYGSVPGAKTTSVTAPGATAAASQTQDFKDRLARLPESEQTVIKALVAQGDFARAEAALDRLSASRQAIIRTVVIPSSIKAAAPSLTKRNAEGGVLEAMAAGGIRGLSPMAPVAQMVPPNTWRVVGDRVRDDEAYIPLDGSARSWAILAEALRRMPGAAPMADGAVVAGGRSLPSGDVATAVREGLASARFYLDGQQVAVVLGFGDDRRIGHMMGV